MTECQGDEEHISTRNENSLLPSNLHLNMQNFDQSIANGGRSFPLYQDAFTGDQTTNAFQFGFHGVKCPQAGFLEQGSFSTSSGCASVSGYRSNQQAHNEPKGILLAPGIMENISMKMDATFNVSATSGPWGDFSYHHHNDMNMNKNMNNNRGRTTYTEQQVIELEEAFTTNPYPTAQNRLVLSQKVGVPEGKVKIWFQNRRARAKKMKSSIILPWKKTSSSYCENKPDELSQNNKPSPQHVPHIRHTSAFDSLLPLPTTSGSVPPKKLPLSFPQVHKYYHNQPMQTSNGQLNGRQQSYWYHTNYNIARQQSFNEQEGFRFPTVWSANSIQSNYSRQYHPQYPICNNFGPEESEYSNAQYNEQYLSRADKEAPTSDDTGKSICTTVATLDLNGGSKDHLALSESKSSDNNEEQEEEIINYEMKSALHDKYRHSNSMLSPPPVRRYVFQFNSIANEPAPEKKVPSTPNTPAHSRPAGFTGVQLGNPDMSLCLDQSTNESKFQTSRSYNVSLPQSSSAVHPYFGHSTLNFQAQNFNANDFFAPLSSTIADVTPINTGYDLFKPIENEKTDEDKTYESSANMNFLACTETTITEETGSEFVDRRPSDDSTESTCDAQPDGGGRSQGQTTVWTVSNLINSCQESSVSDWEGEKQNYSVPKEFTVQT